jgi:predicted metalloprotease with PDZ domain
VIAHELFHAWNARRLRPAELVPYDFLKPAPSRSLWITEGLTEYFAHRAMYLAGRWTRARYLERISEEATRAAIAQRRNTTVEEDAENAWQAPDDAAADPDAWYARGHLVAFALDARIRSESDGTRALDDVVRTLLSRAEKAGGVLALDPPGLERAVAEAAGEAVAQRLALWTRLPREVERMPEVLAGLGLKLSLEEGPPRAHIGLSVEPDAGTLRVAAVLPASPAAHAGLRAGDRIVLLDGQAPSRKAFEQLADRESGSRIKLEAIRATRRMQMTLLLETVRPPLVRLSELPASPKTSALRESWLRR